MSLAADYGLSASEVEALRDLAILRYQELYSEPQARYNTIPSHEHVAIQDDVNPSFLAESSAYPNPFNISTSIRYKLNEEGPIIAVVSCVDGIL